MEDAADLDSPKLTRRLFLRSTAATAAGAAAAGVDGLGCASMPDLSKGAAAHPCEQRYCRYFRGGDGVGRCSLVVRVAGGIP